MENIHEMKCGECGQEVEVGLSGICESCGADMSEDIAEYERMVLKKDTSAPVKSIPCRYVQLQDDEGIIFLAITNLTKMEIINAGTDESLDDDNLDYEGKMLRHAELLNKDFERIHVNVISI